MIHHNDTQAEIFNIHFYDNEYLILQKDQTNEFAFLIDERRFNEKLQISIAKKNLEKRYSEIDGIEVGHDSYQSVNCWYCGQQDVNHLGQCPQCRQKLI